MFLYRRIGSHAVPEFLTTKEVAALLRIKERKVYELVAEHAIPVSRVTGKLLFPREMVEAWVWQQAGVSTVIPGARNVSQASANAAAGSVGALPASFLEGVAGLYDRKIREQVHGRW